MNWAIDLKTVEHYRVGVEMCAVDPVYQIFRQVRIIRTVIETKGSEFGDSWPAALRACPLLGNVVDKILHADSIGSPEVHWYIPGCGRISSTMSHYCLCAAIIDRVTGGLGGGSLVEIGSGYGGLLAVLSAMYPVAALASVDIPETKELRERYLWDAGARNVQTLPVDVRCSPDCVVSFAALSELNGTARDGYARNILAGSRAGVLGWNWPEPPNPDRFPSTRAALAWLQQYVPTAAILSDLIGWDDFGQYANWTIVWGMT